MSSRIDTEVWALDRCTGCGSCVALCSKNVLTWGTEEHPFRLERQKNLGLSSYTLDTCSFCPTFCEMACPRLEEDWRPLEARRQVSVKTKGLVESGEPSEVIKHLLVASMAAGFIDGAILPDLDPWTLEPVVRVASSVGEIMDTLAIPYLWAPTLDKLNEAIYDCRLQKLAVVGPPCVSQALRKLRMNDNSRLASYRQALRLTISPFCTGVFRPDLIPEFLDREMGIAPQSIRRLQAMPRENSLTVTLWDGTTRSVSLEVVDGYTRHGCARCDDYLGESADVGVGTVGASDGQSTLITRSFAGDVCLRNALDYGLLETGDDINRTALVQASEEKDKRQRAQSFDRLTVMLLDALGEPRKRTEVKQAFVRLYGAKPREMAQTEDYSRKEAGCHGTCSGC